MEFAAVGYGWRESGFLEESRFFKSAIWNLNGILTKQQVISLTTTTMTDTITPNGELRPDYDETSLKNGVVGNMQSNMLPVQTLSSLH